MMVLSYLYKYDSVDRPEKDSPRMTCRAKCTLAVRMKCDEKEKKEGIVSNKSFS